MREPTQVIRELHDAVAVRGSAPLELYSPDCELYNVEATPEPPFVGHQGVRDWEAHMRSIVEPMRIDLEHVLDSGGGQIVTLSVVRGEGRTSGLPVEFPLWMVWTVRDGLITRARAYLTRDAALAAARG